MMNQRRQVNTKVKYLFNVYCNSITNNIFTVKSVLIFY